MIEYYKNLSTDSLFYINDEGLVCQEEWIKINIGEIYFISSLGRLKSIRTIKKSNSLIIKIIKQQICKKGYLKYCFYDNGNNKSIKIHRLVAEYFIPNPLNLPQVNHIGKMENGKEGNKLDNRVVSLKWCTSKENVIHSFSHGISKGLIGEKNSASKLTNNDVLNIRKMILLKEKRYKIASFFGVTRKVIYSIEYGLTWKHI